MKRILRKSLLIAVLIGSALTAPAADLTWENNGLFLAPPAIPPTIDAVNFVNRNQFIINFALPFSIDQDFGSAVLPFQTSDTRNFTNDITGFMACNIGFNFNFYDIPFGRVRPASSFHNAGIINCGTTDTASIFEVDRPFFFGTTNVILIGFEGAACIVNATNIVNPGTIHMGFESDLDIHGKSVDLSYGTLMSDAEGFSIRGVNEPVFGGRAGNPFFNGAIFDGYWGVGDVKTQPIVFYPNGIPPAAFFGSLPPTTPFFPVTLRGQQNPTQVLTMGGSNFVSYLDIVTDLATTNTYTTAVFVANTNPAVQANVYFVEGLGSPVPIVEFTNLLGTTTNNVYVEDIFGVTTNLQLIPNGVAGSVSTAIPYNYSVGSFPPNLFFGITTGGPAQPQQIPPGTFPSQNVTNQWSAYEAILSPLSIFLPDLAGQNVTNVQGAMRIVADDYLNLTNAQISSLNYLLLKATNHFDLGTDARISSPAIDLNLRSTNGLITLSNLFATTLPRSGGVIDLYSARWTNVVNDPVSGVMTNHFHVLFVDAKFSLAERSRGQDVILRANGAGSSDSIVINDGLTVTHSLLLDAARVTIGTNEMGADPASGSIVITSPEIVWPTSAPRLQYFTNNGFFSASNTVFFGGSRSAPYYTTTFIEPYQAFVNTGIIVDNGSVIEANIFENSGSIIANGGSITLTSTDTLLTNGAFLAPTGAVSITTGSLIVSNHALVAGNGPITLAASYLLDDGTLAAGCPDLVSNKNSWIASGFNLTQLPSFATLLSTTVTNIAFNHSTVQNTWAASDLGASPAGFSPNNAPVGRLILDGRDPSTRFDFKGATANNALYVDHIDLENYATNYGGGKYTELSAASNIRIYFAKATAGGESIVDKLNGANGGRFIWVSNYNCGPFSSILMTNPLDGATYTLNEQLRETPFADSDNDGVINRDDPTPVPLPVAACPCTSVVPPPLAIGNPPAPIGGGGDTNVISAPPQLDLPPTSGFGPATETVAQNKGAYTGIFFDTNTVSSDSAGSFTATLSTKGTFSGKLGMGGKTYSFSGTFDSNGYAANVKVARGSLRALTLNLQLDLSGENQIAGTVTDSHWTAQLQAYGPSFDTKKNPATQFTGTYTLDIPGDSSSIVRPAGDGFATVKIDAGGNVQVAGSLADASKLSLKTTLSASGKWPFYVSLYKGAGCAIGWLQTTNHSLSGRVVWINPGGVSSSASKSYQSGFTNRIDTLGLRYVAPPSGQSLFDWSYGNIILSGGGFGSATNLVMISNKNKLTISDDTSLKLTLTPSSGLFQGSILNPDTRKAIKFQGALFPDLNRGLGLGYFINSDQSGLIYLGPAP